MSIFRNHLLLMAAYALLTGSFLALLWKEERRDRVRLFLIVSGSLFVGGILLAWIMFPFPLR